MRGAGVPGGAARALWGSATLHDCITAVTAERPEATALIAPDGTRVSFAALEARKRQILFLLADHGIGPGDCVGLHGDASADHIAGLLALMHRGAVAVPLAADLPLAYRRGLLERAGAALVLSSVTDLPQALGWPEAGAPAVPQGEAPEPAGADSPFLLMFTSGSTGTPKGVLHAHRQPVNRFRWMLAAHPPGPQEVFAARPVVSVMPAIWEQLGGLCCGVPTQLLDRAALLDPARYLAALSGSGVTRMTVTPALMRVLLTELERDGAPPPPPLSLLTIGGEPLPDRLLARMQAALPGCAILEDYGATEVNTIGAALRTRDGTPVFAPISGVEVAVADAQGTPLPAGEEGELCVAGEGLALCYWGDTALTEARFGPCAGLPRAYRTGDRARLLPDGRFALLGRTRDLVKINGQAVDLVAIERALREIPGIEAAAAFVHRPEGRDWARLCAAVVGPAAPQAEALRAHLRRLLPPAQVPALILPLGDLPRLPGGKPDRAALEALPEAALVPGAAAPVAAPVQPAVSVSSAVPVLTEASVPPSGAATPARVALVAAFRQVTGRALSASDDDQTWDALGLDSLAIVAFAQALSATRGIDCAATDLFDHMTPRRLAAQLEARQPAPLPAPPPAEAPAAAPVTAPAATPDRLAIVGMAAMVPGADSLSAFREMILTGRVVAPRVPQERWPEADPGEAALSGAFLDDIMSLDPALHGLSPAEAAAADPQMRLALRAVRLCLQDAGLSRAALAGTGTGVFVALRPSGYAGLASPEEARRPEAFLGGDEAMIAARIAHSLDLHGPAVTVNTTCSSGLVALHQARAAIAAGDCSRAIVCAVSVICDPEFLRRTLRLGVVSPSGRCRPFDVQADGFVPAEAVACVLVEPAAVARAEGRAPWAEILATGLNHDGLSNSLTAPNGSAQAALISAVRRALPPGTPAPAYIETHGTGTALGDPVEARALCEGLGDMPGPVALGSLKGNIGHANAAAGLLGLVKTALCLETRQVPPLAGFSAPNPTLGAAVLQRLLLPVAAMDWPADRPVAAVSAFGMSGTNAHVVLARPPAAGVGAEHEAGQGWARGLVLSAPSPAALRRHAADLARALGSIEAPLAAVAATLQARTPEACHAWIPAPDGALAAAIEGLRALAAGVAPLAVPEDAQAAWSGPLLHLPASDECGEVPADQALRRSAPPAATPLAAAVALPAAVVAARSAGAPTDGHDGLERLLSETIGPQDWAAMAAVALRDLGLDSIKSLGLREGLRVRFGLEVTEFELLEGASLASLRALASPVPLAPVPPATVAPVPAPVPPVPVLAPTPGVPAPLPRPAPLPDSAPLTELQGVYLTAKLGRGALTDRLGAWNLMVLLPEARPDPEALSRAWHETCLRHGMLRVTLSATGRQRIAPPAAQPDPVPVSADGPGVLDRVLQEMMQRAARPDAPAAALHLLRGAQGDRLVLAMDSFAADARSTRQVLRDLMALMAGQDLPSPPAEAAFLGLAAAAAARAGQEPDRQEAAAAHWATRLGGLGPVDLGTGAAGSETGEGGWTRLSRPLAAAACAALTAQAQAAGVPVTLAAMARVRDWLGQEAGAAGLIGLTVAERPAGAEAVVGPFTEMMLHPLDPARPLAPAALHQALAQDLAHRALTGTALLRRSGLAPPRIVLSVVTEPHPLPRLRVECAISITSGIDLHIHLTREPEGTIRLDWDVNGARLSPGRARALFERCCSALSADAPAPGPGEAPGPVPGSAAAPAAAAPPAAPGPFETAPLTRAMRSYQVAQAAARGAQDGSQATRIYAVPPAALPAILTRWARLLDTHAALHAVRTPRGQLRPRQRAIAAQIEAPELPPGLSRVALFHALERHGAAALARHAWPPMRLALGQAEGDTYLAMSFDCAALDAPATLSLPQALLSGADLGADAGADCGADPGADPDAGFEYARWQAQAEAADPGYWAEKLAPLARWGAAAPPLPSPGGRTLLLHHAFPRPEGAEGMALAARVACAFQASLAACPELAALPVMTVGYADRQERPGWARAAGDFSTFGFLPPGLSAGGPKAVRAVLAADAAQRRSDWFPQLAGRVPRGQTLFPAVFTDGLSHQPDHPEPGGSAVWTGSHTAGPHLDCLAYSTKGVIRVEWSVNTSTLDETRARAAFDAFRDALQEGAPDLIPVPQMAPQEGAAAFQARHNRTEAPFDRTATMVSMIDRAAAAQAQGPALVDDAGTLSYGAMQAEVHRLAAALRDGFGVGRGSIVAVRLPRDRTLPLVLLAILRLGAAFVPLNAGDPSERHAQMLQRAAADLVILTEPDAALGPVRQVTPGALRAAAADARPGLVADAALPEGLAYIIFTSGSTGEPKGVMVRHQPVVNLFEDLQARYGFGPKDRGIWVNAVGFDLTIFDIFGLLAQGASLRIVNEADRLDPLAIARIIGAEPITFWNSAPVYFQAVIGQLLSPRFTGSCDLRLAFFSGDWVPLDMARQCLARLPQMRAVALGGATEATVWSNLHEIREVRPDWRSIPYGRPIRNARYYILDEAGAMLPPGIEGDLFIGGSCLAEGYVNAPELNARAFLPDPFSDAPGARMYRTGDRAQFWPDGEIEFLGRADGQVKIRGHRVELGEIEHAMEAAGYRAPVVLASAGGQGQTVARSLTGFCLRPEPEAEQAARLMAQRLPGYMVPGRVIALEAYPVTVNGKLDRRALAQLAEAPGGAAPNSDAGGAGQRAATLTVQPSGGAAQAVVPPAVLAVAAAPVAVHAVAGPPAEEIAAGQSLRGQILETVAGLLDLPQGDLDLSLGLGHQGFNSLHFALLANAMADLIGQDVPTSDILPLASLREVLAYAEARRPPVAVAAPAAAPPAPASLLPAAAVPAVPATAPPEGEAIAIIGMTCRMPGAMNEHAFWDNILAGRDCIGEVPESRWDWQALHGDDPARNESLSRWGGFIEGVDLFDPARFAITPREAAAMDPRQRLLLSAAWTLFEEAGHAPVTAEPRDIGVFLGVTGDEYGSLLSATEVPQDQLSLLGTGRSFIANRINYAMNWSGPSEVIDTTCSSSLVAIHHAVSALRGGDCAMAVAGGVSVMIDPAPHVALSRVGVLAADGRCKTFDARADGYVRSEGIGLVLLKPLARALRDGDRVRAVIRACRINHGGRSSSMTAPNVAAQSALLEATLREAGPGIAGLGLHEAHGTGTRLGDPIEVAAYQSALGAQLAHEGLAQLPAPVSMGALKSAIGHTEAAAGVAGVIKAVLALEHRALPPLVHLGQENPEIARDPARVVFDRSARDWPAPAGGLRRRASVSAFGFGGVNAFAVLEEAPAPVLGADAAADAARPELIVLSARTPDLLAAHAEGLAHWLEGAGAAVPLRDIAHSLRLGRVQDRCRRALVCDSRAALPQMLRQTPEPGTEPGAAAGGEAGAALAQALAQGDLTRAGALWVAGAEADWSVLSRPDARRVSLPATPRDERPYWHEALPRRPARLRAGWRAPRVVAEGLRFRVTARDGFLADHMIGGQALLPGAAMIAAVLRLGGGALSDVTFRAALALGDAPCADLTAQLEGGRIALQAEGHAGAASTLLATARPAAMPAAGPDLQSHGRSYAQLEEAAACAARLAALGVGFGPLYRIARSFWHSPDEGLLHVQLPQESHAEGPAIPMLDALFQAIVLFESVGGATGARVPFHIERVALFADPGAEGYVRVARSADRRRHDAALYDAIGRLCVRFEGVTGQDLPPPTGRGTAQSEGRERSSQAGPAAKAGHEGGFLPLMPHWRAVSASPGGLAAARPGVWRLDWRPEAPDDDDAAAAAGWLGAEVPALSLTLAPGPGEAAALVRRLAAFVQGLAARPGALELRPRSLCVVLPAGADWAAALAQGIAGLALTLRREHPALSLKALLCAAGAEPDAAAGAVHDHTAPGLYRAGAGGLEIADLAPCALAAAGDVPADGGAAQEGGFVVITGGGGLIGRTLAAGLAAGGAPVLALGRGATPPDALPAGVAYAQADVTDAAALGAALASARARFGPVRAVYHCAGLAPGGLFARRAPEAIAAQIAVKLGGALALDAATAADAPRVFVACSSLVGHGGIVGCADYAMANRALEAVVTARDRARPGRSLAIAWSAWPEGGMQFAGPQAARLSRRLVDEGIRPVDPAQALPLIAAALATPGLSTLAAPFGDRALLQQSFGPAARALGQALPAA